MADIKENYSWDLRNKKVTVEFTHTHTYHSNKGNKCTQFNEKTNRSQWVLYKFKTLGMLKVKPN